MPTCDSSFLSELAMLDDSDNGYAQEWEQREYERYVKLGQGGPGKADEPLKWWKVSACLSCHILVLIQFRLGSCAWVSHHFVNGLWFLGNPRCQRVCRMSVFEIPAPLYGPPRGSESDNGYWGNVCKTVVVRWYFQPCLMWTQCFDHFSTT